MCTITESLVRYENEKTTTRSEVRGNAYGILDTGDNIYRLNINICYSFVGVEQYDPIVRMCSLLA